MPSSPKADIRLTDEDLHWGNLKGIGQRLADITSGLPFDPKHEVFEALTSEEAEDLHGDLMLLLDDIRATLDHLRPAKAISH